MVVGGKAYRQFDPKWQRVHVDVFMKSSWHPQDLFKETYLSLAEAPGLHDNWLLLEPGASPFV